MASEADIAGATKYFARSRLMRAEIQTHADDIRESLALLRRYL